MSEYPDESKPQATRAGAKRLLTDLVEAVEGQFISAERNGPLTKAASDDFGYHAVIRFLNGKSTDPHSQQYVPDLKEAVTNTTLRQEVLNSRDVDARLGEEAHHRITTVINATLDYYSAEKRLSRVKDPTELEPKPQTIKPAALIGTVITPSKRAPRIRPSNFGKPSA